MVNRLRILFVSYMYPPFMEMGGPPLKVRAMAEGLAVRGHEVTVLTANHARPSSKVLRKVGGVEVIYLRQILRYRFVPISLGVRAFCGQRVDSFDIIHLFGVYELTGPVVAGAARREGIPYVLEPLGMYQPLVRSFVKKRVYHRLIGRSLVAGAERLVATSTQEAAELEAAGVSSQKVVVRRNGIDLRRFTELPSRGAFRRKYDIPDGDLLTLFLGRLAEKKRPDQLLKAFSDSGAGANGRLAFVGPDEGGATARLRSLAAASGLRDRVIFTGPIYDEEMKKHALVDADVFVLPSVNENFGNSVAEAMACGTPVIITDRCGIAPFVRDAGAGLVVPPDVESLTTALSGMLSDPGLRTRASRSGKQAAAELGWEEPLSETEEMYRQICDRRSGPNADRQAGRDGDSPAPGH